MKIAVTYDNGNVFQHFGRTENFKIYNVENGKVVSSEVMSSNGVGHEALAWLLKDNTVDVLICGGMGQGAQDALAEAGIEVCAGAEGDTDAAVEAYLRGELVNTGVNCDHHHEGHEHHHDHDHAEGGCGGCGDDAGGCAGCPGCGEPMYFFESKNTGKTVKVHYKGTFDNGEQLTGKDMSGTAIADNTAVPVFTVGKKAATEGRALTLQIGDTADSFNKMSVEVADMHTKALGIDKIDISTQEGASEAMQKIKDAINSVSDTRGGLGALQNRLDHTINNLGVMRENIQNAESLIRDTDVAEEMMTYTKNSILNQSAQAMLAQANQLPQGVLQLLG